MYADEADAPGTAPEPAINALMALSLAALWQTFWKMLLSAFCLILMIAAPFSAGSRLSFFVR